MTSLEVSVALRRIWRRGGGARPSADGESSPPRSAALQLAPTTRQHACEAAATEGEKVDVFRTAVSRRSPLGTGVAQDCVFGAPKEFFIPRTRDHRGAPWALLFGRRDGAGAPRRGAAVFRRRSGRTEEGVAAARSSQASVKWSATNLR